MQYRKLGKKGPKVPVVGFGGWPIGGGMGAVDEKVAIRTVKEAIENGLTFIDTAEAYKSSESRIGKALRGYDRDQYFLATKVIFDLSSKGVINALEKSLKNLGVDYVDLYQIHQWDDTVPVEETLEAINKLKEQGKLKYIGVSNFRVEHLTRAIKVAPIVSNQINYNMFLRTAENQLLSFCEQHGVGIMVHSTLAKGLLTGQYKQNHRFKKDDERSEFTQYQGNSFNRYIDAAEQLKIIANDIGSSLIALAIAWALRNKEVSIALVGIKNQKELIEPIKAGDLILSDKVINRINDLLNHYKLEYLSPSVSQIV
jgi:aryl-alcohol dehydrogenase-like predicted oxidoreductase